MSSSGITVEYTEKGWLVNGTSTASTYSVFTLFEKELPAGTYTINGIVGASGNTFQIALQKNGATQ